MRAVQSWARAGLAVSLFAATAVATVFPSATPAAAETIFVEYTKPTRGPRGAVTVIGDSVMLGSTLEVEGYGPSVSQMLVDRGWGPVLAKAGVGFQAGSFVGTNTGASMSKFVLDKRAAGWDSPVYMISIGPNDVLYCDGNQACAEKDILGLVDTIGPGHEIWWSMITTKVQRDQDVWNAALTAVAAQRPFLRTWDWPTVLANTGIPISGDHTHLPTGAAYVKKSLLMADDFTARLGQSQAVGAGASIPSAIGAPTEYQPLPQDRVYDSRKLGARANGVVQIDLSAKVPAGSSAVSVNVTAVGPSTAGYLSAYPCGGALPVTSTVNFGAGETQPNNAVVGLGAGNLLCVYASTPSDVLVDLQGAFVPSGGLRLTTQPPQRLVDTRVTGRADPLVVQMPAGAAGVVLNLTAVNAVAAGYLVAYPCDAAVPATSNLNFVAADASAGSVYAQVSAAATVCIHGNVPLDVVVDLQGTFSAGGALRFQASTPQRMIDTRSGDGGWLGQVGQNQTISFPVAPASAAAVTGNLTMVLPGTDGYSTAYGCGADAPKTSSVNAARTHIVANSVTTGATGTLCVLSSVGAHVLFDTTGWWIP